MRTEKILVSVLLAATRKSYDFWLPSASKISTASSLVSEILKARESDWFTASGYDTLASCADGKPLLPTQSIKEAGLTNGDRLMLV